MHPSTILALITSAVLGVSALAPTASADTVSAGKFHSRSIIWQHQLLLRKPARSDEIAPKPAPYDAIARVLPFGRECMKVPTGCLCNTYDDENYCCVYFICKRVHQ
jgi:hypothetical protein